MTSRRRIIQTVIAAFIIALCLPALAMAQGGYPWGQDNRQGTIYNNGRYDDRNDRYNQRRLRDSIRRVKDRSRDFQRHLDSALDRSRYDDTNREDRINDLAREFRDAAEELKDRSDDGRNINRSSNEARRLLQIAARIDRFMSRNRLDSRVMSDWAQMRQDLNVIADVYGFRTGDFDGGYNGRGGNNGRGNDGRGRGGRWPF